MWAGRENISAASEKAAVRPSVFTLCSTTTAPHCGQTAWAPGASAPTRCTRPQILQATSVTPVAGVQVARHRRALAGDALAHEPLLVVGVWPDLRLPAPDVGGVVPALGHRQLRVLDLVHAEIAGLAGGRRPIAHGVHVPGQLGQERQVLGVVELVEELVAVRLDVHHHPEHIGRLAGEGGGATHPLVAGEVAIHRVRADLPRPASGLAGRLPRGAVEDGGAVQLVGRHVARLGRGRLRVAARPAHAGHGLEILHVLLVVDLVEDRLVVVRHVHPDQEERVGAHLLTWGGPTWPPTPPNARSAPGNPWRSSATRALIGTSRWTPSRVRRLSCWGR